MLFVDMIHVQWRHAGRTGKIIVRGTDNLFLFAYTLVPPARVCLLPGMSQENSELSRDLCCYYHTINCMCSLLCLATTVLEKRLNARATQCQWGWMSSSTPQSLYCMKNSTQESSVSSEPLMLHTTLFDSNAGFR